MSPIIETVAKIFGIALVTIVAINVLVVLLKKKLNNKAPRPKGRSINTALQATGFRQPSPQGTGNLPEEIKDKAPVFHVKLIDEEEPESEVIQKKIDYQDSYLAKKQLLSKDENLFRNILKAGLPGHEIFANVRLADIVKVHPKHRGNKNTWLFRNIAQYHIDFLVCDKETKIIAAFELDDPSHDNNDGEKRDAKKDECLNAVGIKLIRIRVENMPRHSEIRNMVYGTQ